MSCLGKWFLGWGLLGFAGALAWRPALLSGQVRTDGNITIAAEAIGLSGGRVSGGNTLNDSSIGGTGAGIAQDASSATTVKNGYVGQLYEILGLAVSAIPDTVDERADTQLNAEAVLDDDSIFKIDPTKVQWSVQSGPVTGVSGSGLATADTVFGDTVAVLGAAYLDVGGQLNLTVRNISNDDFPGLSGDGIPDDWQAMFFLNDLPKAGPDVDADGDGQNNLLEYALNGNPTDGRSGNELLPSPATEPDGPDEFLALTFTRRAFPAQVTYLVEVSADLTSGVWTQAVQVGSSVPDGNGFETVTFRDTVAVGAAPGPRFIRIRIVAAPEGAAGG